MKMCRGSEEKSKGKFMPGSGDICKIEIPLIY
jgi:hypothetical protein